MKATLLLSIILALLLSIAVGVGFAPYHFFNLAQDEGLSSNYLKMKIKSADQKMGGEYQMVKMPGLYGEDEDLWEKFHFAHFEIPLPIRNPMYQFVPDIVWIDKKPQFGGKLLEASGKELGRFRVGEKFKMTLDFDGNRIFNLPIFKNYILKIGPEKVWQDIFKLKIKNRYFSWTNPLASFNFLGHGGLEQMVYELFILHMREKLLSDRIGDFGFYSKKNIGIIEINDLNIKELGGKESDFRQEKLFFYDQGIIYTFYLKTRLENIVAEALRKKFVKRINLKFDDEDSSIPIYAKYKELRYDRKIDQEGMTYLYSAWSHVYHKKEFLREMIHFLERGKKNNLQIKPLYDYAYKIFGTSFSRHEGDLKETATEKLNRKISEEVDKEILEIEKNNQGEVEENFPSMEAKVKFYLQKAKNSGTNIDDETKSLNID